MIRGSAAAVKLLLNKRKKRKMKWIKLMLGSFLWRDLEKGLRANETRDHLFRKQRGAQERSRSWYLIWTSTSIATIIRPWLCQFLKERSLRISSTANLMGETACFFPFGLFLAIIIYQVVSYTKIIIIHTSTKSLGRCLWFLIWRGQSDTLRLASRLH